MFDHVKERDHQLQRDNAELWRQLENSGDNSRKRTSLTD